MAPNEYSSTVLLRDGGKLRSSPAGHPAEQDEISAAERLIAGLKQSGQCVSENGKNIVLPVQYDKVVDQLTELFERYVRSVLHDLHKQEYLPILTHAELPPEQNPIGK